MRLFIFVVCQMILTLQWSLLSIFAGEESQLAAVIPAEVERACAVSLGEIGNREGVPYLLHAVKKNPYSGVREASAISLGMIGDWSAGTDLCTRVDEIKENGEETDTGVRQAIREALEKMGYQCVGKMIAQVQIEQGVMLHVPKGLSLIGIPIKVTMIGNKEIKGELTVGDLYDALGDSVGTIVTYDNHKEGWTSYTGDKNDEAGRNKIIKQDTGIGVVMTESVSLLLNGEPLVKEGKTKINIDKGINFVSIPLKDERLKRVSDLLNLEGLKGKIQSIIVYDNGEFKIVTQAGDDGDIEIKGDDAYIITARDSGTAEISERLISQEESNLNLISKLSSQDDHIRKIGYEELVKKGRDVIPLLIQTMNKQSHNHMLRMWGNKLILSISNEPKFLEQIESLGVINVKEFGAFGDGITDDTQALQKALISVPEGGVLYIPKGNYVLSSALKPSKSYTAIQGEGEETILSLAPNVLWNKFHGMINVAPTVSNIAISDLVVDGTVQGRQYAETYGIKIRGASYITIERVIARDHTGTNERGTSGGDGFYIGAGNWEADNWDGKGDPIFPHHITLREVVADNNVRQGLSITAGNDILIEKSTFKNTRGDNPGGGIDIEPYWKVSNIKIKDNRIEMNEVGIYVSYSGLFANRQLPITNYFENIEIIDNMIQNNRVSPYMLYVGSYIATIKIVSSGQVIKQMP